MHRCFPKKAKQRAHFVIPFKELATGKTLRAQKLKKKVYFVFS